MIGTGLTHRTTAPILKVLWADPNAYCAAEIGFPTHPSLYGQLTGRRLMLTLRRARMDSAVLAISRNTFLKPEEGGSE